MMTSLMWHGDCASQVEETDAAQAVDPRVQTGNRDKRAKRAFNFVEEGTFIKQVQACSHGGVPFCFVL